MNVILLTYHQLTSQDYMDKILRVQGYLKWCVKGKGV